MIGDPLELAEAKAHVSSRYRFDFLSNVSAELQATHDKLKFLISRLRRGGLNQTKVMKNKKKVLDWLAEVKNVEQENCARLKMPDPSQCSMTGNGLAARAVVGKNSTVDLTLLDFRRIVCKEVLLESLQCRLYSAGAGGAVVDCSVESTGVSGQYSVTYQPSHAGEYQLHILVCDQHMMGSPFSVSAKSAKSTKADGKSSYTGRKRKNSNNEDSPFIDRTSHTERRPSSYHSSARSSLLHNQVEADRTSHTEIRLLVQALNARKAYYEKNGKFPSWDEMLHFLRYRRFPDKVTLFDYRMAVAVTVTIIFILLLLTYKFVF